MQAFSVPAYCNLGHQNLFSGGHGVASTKNGRKSFDQQTSNLSLFGPFGKHFHAQNLRHVPLFPRLTTQLCSRSAQVVETKPIKEQRRILFNQDDRLSAGRRPQVSRQQWFMNTSEKTTHQRHNSQLHVASFVSFQTTVLIPWCLCYSTMRSPYWISST